MTDSPSDSFYAMCTNDQSESTTVELNEPIDGQDADIFIIETTNDPINLWQEKSNKKLSNLQSDQLPQVSVNESCENSSQNDWTDQHTENNQDLNGKIPNDEQDMTDTQEINEKIINVNQDVNENVINVQEAIENFKTIENVDKVQNELADETDNVESRKNETKLDDTRLIDKLNESLSNVIKQKRTKDQFEHVSEEENSSDVEIIDEKKSSFKPMVMIDEQSESNLSRSLNESQPSSRNANGLYEKAFILRMKNLPYNATEEDIKKFFKGYRYKQIHLHKVAGRSVGRAFVEFESSADLVRAFDKDGQSMHRSDRHYIELFRATRDDLQICLDDNNYENISISEFIRVRGILYNTTKKDIEEFFKPLKIAMIIIPIDRKLRMTKECYVQFESIEDATKALKKNGEALGSRYVKVIKSTKLQFKSQANAMLRNNLIIRTNALRTFPKQKPSVHKSKLFNISNNDKLLGESINSSNESIEKPYYPVNEIFPYYFQDSEHRKLQRPIGYSVNRGSGEQSVHRFSPSNRSFSTPIKFDSSRLVDNCARSLGRDKRSASSTFNSPQKRPASNGYYFKSFYNDEQDKGPSDYLKVVKVKDLPNNCTREALCEFFEQIELIPKSVRLFVDRGRRYTEAEVTFRTYEDAKKSFLLSGARLQSESGSRNVNVVIHPDLKNVNVINPSTDTSSTLNRNSYSTNYLNQNHSRHHSLIQSNNSSYESSYRSTRRSESNDSRIRRSTHNRLSNSHLIDELKSSLQESMSNPLQHRIQHNPYSRRHIEIN